jgi:hypothetical protein
MLDEYKLVHTRSYMVAVAWMPRLSAQNYVALEKDPVSCALMSDLLRGVRRWPSWVCAYVSGTNLSSVLEAHGC